MKQESVEIRDPAAAALLVHPKAVVALAPFLGNERTLSEAAAVAGLKLPALSYWVKRLLAAGLLQQTRTQAPVEPSQTCCPQAAQAYGKQSGSVAGGDGDTSARRRGWHETGRSGLGARPAATACGRLSHSRKPSVSCGRLRKPYAIPLEECRRVEGSIDTERSLAEVHQAWVCRIERVEHREGRNNVVLVLGVARFPASTWAWAAAPYATSSPSPSSSSIASMWGRAGLTPQPQGVIA